MISSVYDLEKNDLVYFFRDDLKILEKSIVLDVVETKLKKHFYLDFIDGTLSCYKKRNFLKSIVCTWVDEVNDCRCFVSTSKEKLLEELKEYDILVWRINE